MSEASGPGAAHKRGIDKARPADRPEATEPSDKDRASAAAADRMGATAVAYLLTGPALYAFVGWLADRWLGTSFLLPVGLVAGMALSLYVLWLRYGKP